MEVIKIAYGLVIYAYFSQYAIPLSFIQDILVGVFKEMF